MTTHATQCAEGVIADGDRDRDGGAVSELPDFADEQYWKTLPVEALIRLMQDQLDESYADLPKRPPFPMWGDVARESLMTVGSDILDRATDQAGCAKADSCTAAALFLAWLAWNIDDLAKDTLAAVR